VGEREGLTIFVRIVAVVLGSALVLGACAGSTPASSTMTLSATLGGNAVVPGPGDPDGSGSVTVTIKPADQEICYTYSFTFTDVATSAVVAKGADGNVGIPVASLFTTQQPGTTGCAHVEHTLVLADLANNPSSYYVQFATAAYPEGALRGQLRT
jgi:hypothetical protein